MQILKLAFVFTLWTTLIVQSGVAQAQLNEQAPLESLASLAKGSVVIDFKSFGLGAGLLRVDLGQSRSCELTTHDKPDYYEFKKGTQLNLFYIDYIKHQDKKVANSEIKFTHILLGRAVGQTDVVILCTGSYTKGQQITVEEFSKAFRSYFQLVPSNKKTNKRKSDTIS